jgi:hypothetical protein
MAIMIATASAAGGAVGAAMLLVRLEVAPGAGSIGWALSVSASCYVLVFIGVRQFLGVIRRYLGFATRPTRRIDELHFGKVLVLLVLSITLLLIIITPMLDGMSTAIDHATRGGGHPSSVGFRDAIEIVLVLGLFGHLTLVMLARLPFIRRSDPSGSVSDL